MRTAKINVVYLYSEIIYTVVLKLFGLRNFILLKIIEDPKSFVYVGCNY